MRHIICIRIVTERHLPRPIFWALMVAFSELQLTFSAFINAYLDLKDAESSFLIFFASATKASSAILLATASHIKSMYTRCAQLLGPRRRALVAHMHSLRSCTYLSQRHVQDERLFFLQHRKALQNDMLCHCIRICPLTHSHVILHVDTLTLQSDQGAPSFIFPCRSLLIGTVLKEH